MSNMETGELVVYFNNCNSIYKKIPEIKTLLTTKQPDVVCLCETWLRQKYEPKFKDYICWYKHRLDGRGGGLAMLVRKEIQHFEHELNIYGEGVMEVQALRMITHDLRNIYILNVYNPSKNVTIQELEHYILQLGEHYIITGDFNAHSPIIDSESTVRNQTGKSIEDLLATSNVCLVNPDGMKTYIDRRSGKTSSLDLCFSSPGMLPNVSIMPYMDVGSDHILLKINVNIYIRKYAWKSIPRFRVNDKNINKLRTEYVYSTINQPTNINSYVEDFTQRLTSSAEKTFGPPRTLSTTPKKMTPWWNDECGRVVADRRRACNQFRKHPTTQNLINYKRLTAIARSTINRVKRSALEDYIQNITHNMNIGEVWKHIKAFTTTYAPQPYPLIKNNEPLTTAEDKAEGMKEYLMEQETEHEDDQDINKSLALKMEPEESELSKEITSEEYLLSMNKLKDKSPGCDMITNRMIRHCHASYQMELLNIYNQSLITGEMPKIWKKSYIIPIQKPKKPKEEFSSYRPISLLSCLGKLLERIIQKRLETYLERNNKLQVFQHGFRPCKGVEDVIFSLKLLVQDALKAKKSCGVVYVDLKGAFDRVWRQGLLHKAAELGITGSILRWLRSYLEDRKNSVIIHGTLSSEYKSANGVPQGGVLSPLLFNIMMNDMPRSTNVDLYVFADDITIACTGKSTEFIESNLQQYINKLMSWFGKWKFEVNKDKTKMQFFTRRKIRTPALNCNGTRIERVMEQRLLGVVLDAPRMTLVPHVRYTVADCNRRINIMKTLSSPKYGASHKILQQFYTAYIRSKLLFCPSILADLSKTQKNKMNTLQNSALRCILGARRSTPILSLQAETNIPPVHLWLTLLASRYFNSITFKPENDQTAEHTRKSKSAMMLYSQLCETLLLQSPTRFKRYPLEVTAVEVEDTYINYIRSDAPDLITDAAFQNYIMEEYPYFNHIYVDGSKKKGEHESVAAGMFIPAQKIAVSWRLHPEHTVVSAELFAIYKALQHIETQGMGSSVIFSDSRTSLQIIQGSTKQYRNTVNNIRAAFNRVNIGRVVHLHWVKAHVGIRGNEEADKVANLGHNINKSVIYPLHKEEYDQRLKKRARDQFNQYWKQSCQLQQKGLFLYKIRDSATEQTAVDTGCRPLDVAIFRLRLGHTGLNSQLYKFKLSPSPLCVYCNVEETITHYLIECKKYEDERRKYLVDVAQVLRKVPPFPIKILLGGGELPSENNAKLLRLLATYVKDTNKTTVI